MTKNEAIMWMTLGAKCEHKYFSTGEWVSIDETGMYVLEDGVRCTPDEFWHWRTEPYWETDWEFAEGWDAYSCIAAREYGCPPSEVTPYMRELVKMNNIATMYGRYGKLFE